MTSVPSTAPPATGLLLSGGLDSCILAGRLLDDGWRVQPFYIRCGLFWESAEHAAAEKFLAAIAQPRLAPLVTFDLPLADVYGNHWSLTGHNTPSDATPDEAVFLPGRNALLLLKPSVWCQLHGVESLALAPLAGNPFGDATDEFFADFETMLGHLGATAPKIQRPFRQYHKREVMLLGRHLPLELSFSCIAPQAGSHCGVCNKCGERRAAFRDADLPDRTLYAASPSA